MNNETCDKRITVAK